MTQDLASRFQMHHKLTPHGEEFLHRLEKEIAQDLWQSAGGFWSEESIMYFREQAMQKLAAGLQDDSLEEFRRAWSEVVRDFHKNHWNQTRIAKKEKKAKTAEQKIFWELFSYIWMLLQALFVTKTAVFYLGIKSAEEDTVEGKIYVLLAIAFSFGSLIFFAIRKSKKNPEKDT